MIIAFGSNCYDEYIYSRKDLILAKRIIAD